VATATELTRADRIEHHSELEAIELVARGGVGNSADEFFQTFNFEDEGLGIRHELFAELWPDDGPRGTGSEEFKLADARTLLLAAKLFEHLAEIGPGQASYYRDLAASRLAEIGEGATA
jgi:hypothetical protein